MLKLFILLGLSSIVAVRGDSHLAASGSGDKDSGSGDKNSGEPDVDESNGRLAANQASWNNHVEAFTESDVDKILLDYTEDSVITVTDFQTNVNAVFEGLDGVRTCFEALFAYLAKTDGAFPSSLAVPDDTVEDDQVFLIWRAPAAGIKHATDTFIFDANSKFLTQTVTLWTTDGNPILTGDSANLTNAVPGTGAQDHWENHLDAFATGNITKMVLDYRDDAQIIEWDLATDTKNVYTGISGVQELFPKYFGWASACDPLDVDLPTIRVFESYIYLHVTFPCAGIPLWTDTFILDSDGMIVKQNIIFESGFEKTGSGDKDSGEPDVDDTDGDDTPADNSATAALTSSVAVLAVATATAIL